MVAQQIAVVKHVYSRPKNPVYTPSDFPFKNCLLPFLTSANSAAQPKYQFFFNVFKLGLDAYFLLYFYKITLTGELS